MSFVSAVSRSSQVMVKLQRAFLYYITLSLALAMLTDMASRFFFNQSVFGLSDFVGYASVWLYAIGSSFATYENSHIKAEFINGMVRSHRARHIFRLIAASVSTLMSAIFTKWSYDLCVYSIEIQEKTQAYPVPKVIFQASFFVGGILMTIYFIWEIIDCLISLKEDRPFIPSESH